MAVITSLIRSGIGASGQMEVCKGTIYTFQISVNSGAGTAYPSEAPEFTSGF
jgi:hypothetical protein